MTLAIEVDAFIEKTKVRREKILQAIALAAEARVKELTPVVTGFLRANWIVTLDVDAVEVIRPGQEPAQDHIADLTFGKSFYIVNPVVYAMRVEYGFNGEDSRGRMYHQHARGMAQQTIKELPQIAERVVESMQE